MLREIINILQTEEAPLSLDGLSRRLDVDKRALEGMLETLVHKGLIVKDQTSMESGEYQCGGFACRSCAVSSHCPFASKIPQTYTLVESKQ